MLVFLFYLVAILLFFTVVTYIMMVLREKTNLKQKMIVIESSAVDRKLISKIGKKEFVLKNKEIRAGDEIKIKALKGSFYGIFVGADAKEQFLVLVDKYDEIIYIPINELMKIRIISKYGKFLNF